MGMSLATKRRGGELLSFYHRVAFEISNYCDRHFNRKNAVWSVGFIVVQFFKCTYNLICGTNPHEEDYR